MLNKDNERELAYLVKVDAITPMNADRLECAHVGGWHCVVGKGDFNVGDPAVYFEIDSQLPEVEPFTSMAFLASKHYKIKSQKIRGEISQGLLLPVSTFGWSIGSYGCVVESNGNDTIVYKIDDESRFLTKRLNVTYNIPADNIRKSSHVDIYNKMCKHHPVLARTFIWRFMYKRKFGKKILFALFGGREVKKSGWPKWVVKTDEERCQNLPYLFGSDKNRWIVTEKIDGTSSTFTLRKEKFKPTIYKVCSRNVVFDAPNKKYFYDTNVYTETDKQYNMRDKLEQLWDNCKDKNKLLFVTVQGEIYGAGIQQREYSMTDHKLAVFNIIYGYKDGTVKRLNPVEGTVEAERVGLEFVPVLAVGYTLPDTCEELLKYAEGYSRIDNLDREGIVLRTEDGKQSFKAVSNKYLMKYHS